MRASCVNANLFNGYIVLHVCYMNRRYRVKVNIEITNVNIMTNFTRYLLCTSGAVRAAYTKCIKFKFITFCVIDMRNYVLIFIASSRPNDAI